MVPFRFAVQVSNAATAEDWRALARKIESLGYDTLYVPDHLDDQWAPMIALTAAADATTTLTVGSLVLDNDFRHPVLVAREAATLDIVSDGRFELGLGAGWMRTDYDQSGLPFDAPSVRIDRLEESLQIMNDLWRTGSSTFKGTHYQVDGALGSPTPVTKPRPTIVIGGGSKRILTLAAQEAEIVSIVPSLAAGIIGPEVAAEAVADKYHQRVAWVREAAGDRLDQLELQCWTMFVQVVDNAVEVMESVAPAFGFTAEQMAAIPAALVGTTEEITEILLQRRESFGFSYIVVHEAEMEALAPVVATLAGT
jgi:probable F420-dependent oxidoreductase